MAQLNVMRGSWVALIVLLLSAATTASIPAAKSTASVLKSFFTGDGLAATNLALGTYSRSVIINGATEQMRGEGTTEINEGLQQAIVVLTVLDIGGGAIVPLAQTFIDRITNDAVFEATRAAFKTEEPAHVKNLLDFVDKRHNAAYQRNAREYLTRKKVSIEQAFDGDIAKIMKSPALKRQNKQILKHISKVKKLFKLKLAAKALGPLFDIVNIGVSAWSLGTTVRDCINDHVTCNVGAIAASSLCIISGVVGIAAFILAGTAFGPVGTVIAIVLALTATLIEMFYVPPTDPEAELFREHAKVMFQMDAYSRMQLESASKFLWESGLQNTDLYVVNQGHLPNWMESQQPELRGSLTFGLEDAGSYDDEGRVTARIDLPGKCDLFQRRGPQELPALNPGDWRCEYYQEGREDIKLNNRMTERENYYLGPDFYGIPQNWREVHEGNTRAPGMNPIASHNQATYKRPPYEGAMVFVNTNNASNYWLIKNAEGVGAKKTNTKMRGLDIDTEKKFESKPLDERDNFNDVVALGDMRNLGHESADGGHTVKIRTGLGRDVLNIDGWVYKLDADLGANHNTLSFRGMSSKKQKEREGLRNDWPPRGRFPPPGARDIPYDHQLRGIMFNPENGEIIYKTVNSGVRSRDKTTIHTHPIGNVLGVGILNASPFDADEIKLFAVQKDETNPDDHFTVFKYKGNAVYQFDAQRYKSAQFGDSVVNFKVIDSTKGGRDCEHKPKLEITNLRTNAEEKDVQFKDNKIHIYLRNGGSRALGATVSFFTQCPGLVVATDEGNNVKISERRVSELDIMEYTGSRLVYSFGEDTAGSEGDILYVRCPRDVVTSSRTTTDYSIIVISSDFLENCDIDEESDVSVTITGVKRKKNLIFKFSDNAANVKFQGRGQTQKFKKVLKIVNELGADISYIHSHWGKRDSFMLYEAYSSKTGEAMVDQSKLQPGVKNNMKACIRRAVGHERKRNGGGIKRSKEEEEGEEEEEESDFTSTELAEICEY